MALALFTCGIWWGLPGRWGWAGDELHPTSWPQAISLEAPTVRSAWHLRYPPLHFAVLQGVSWPLRQLIDRGTLGLDENAAMSWLIVGLIFRFCHSQQLANLLLHPAVAHGLVLRRIDPHLRAVPGPHAQMHQARFLTQAQDLHEKTRQSLQMATPELCDRGVVRMLIRGQQAPRAGLPAPELRVQEEGLTPNGCRRLRRHLSLLRGAQAARVLIPEGAKLQSLAIDGRLVDPRDHPLEAQLSYYSLKIHTLAPAGQELELGARPPGWYVLDQI